VVNSFVGLDASRYGFVWWDTFGKFPYFFVEKKTG
jgi:hypothetical protein